MVERVQTLRPREVPLGGPRAMTVRRTLPAKERSFVGAWCFADHYGPDDVSVSGGMDVAPHPHCGLATVSWLFSGEVEHRDSLGTVAVVRPGEVNLMTADGASRTRRCRPRARACCTARSCGSCCRRSPRPSSRGSSTTCRRRCIPRPGSRRACSSGRCGARARRCGSRPRCSGSRSCSRRAPRWPCRWRTSSRSGCWWTVGRWTSPVRRWRRPSWVSWRRRRVLVAGSATDARSC